MRIEPQVTRRDDGGWAFTWSPGTPPYAIWLDGLLIATVSTEAVDVLRPNYATAPPDIEVVDSASDSQAESELYPPYMLLQWRGVQNAAGYIVEKFNGSAWVAQNTIRETGQGYYSYRTAPLQDEEAAQFRVKAVDLRSNAGTPVTFSFEVVRNPAHPAVEVEIVAGDVVVSEA